jgi:hypothetical protein
LTLILFISLTINILLERSHLFKSSLSSFLKSLAFAFRFAQAQPAQSQERYFTGAEYRAKFHSLETSDQRFAFRCAQAQPAHSPPLNHGPEVNPVFLFFIKLLTLPNTLLRN